MLLLGSLELTGAGWMEQAEDGKIGLSRGMSPKLEVVGSWILFIIMKCLRVVKLVVIKRWSKGCYHHTISYEFWWRVLSRYPQLTWTNSLERELTYRDSLDLWASLSDLERAWASVILGYWAFLKKTWSTLSYISINTSTDTRSEAAKRPVWR